MLCVTGCVNITPFDKEESEVGYYFLITVGDIVCNGKYEFCDKRDVKFHSKINKL